MSGPGDDDEQAWWVFELPTFGSITYVPAESERQARAKLSAEQYKGAEVESYPFIASRWTSRNAIKRACLGRPVLK